MYDFCKTRGVLFKPNLFSTRILCMCINRRNCGRSFVWIGLHCYCLQRYQQNFWIISFRVKSEFLGLKTCSSGSCGGLQKRSRRAVIESDKFWSGAKGKVWKNSTAASRRCHCKTLACWLAAMAVTATRLSSCSNPRKISLSQNKELALIEVESKSWSLRVKLNELKNKLD